MNCDTAAEAERPLHPAFLSPSWPAGSAANGIVTYVDRMVASLRHAGHRPCVLAVRRSGEAVSNDVYYLRGESRTAVSRVVDGIAFRLNSESAQLRKSAARVIDALTRAQAERVIDLLEMEETFGLTGLIKSRLSIPIVLRLHGPFFALAPWSTDSAAYSVQRIHREGDGIARATAISAVSRDILDRTRSHYGLPLTDAVVIPNPAPIVPVEQRWSLGDCDRSRILFVGRFDRLKGGDVVVDCMRTLVRSFQNIRLWFVSPESKFIDDEGKCWPFPDYLAHHAPEAVGHIDWIGMQTPQALGELRRQAMATVVASRYETFGLTALETMAYGCPLVATRVGGMAETIVDGATGLLCPPSDPGAMAAAITRLLTEPDLAARVGHQAGEHAGSVYHPDRIARQTAEFYRQILEEHRNAPGAR